jgi:hypothetical protein
LSIKITVTVSWFEPQNQVGYGLSVVPQNRWDDEDDAGHALGSSGLLLLEASQARVFQSVLKTGGGTAWMVHVASSWRSRDDKGKDGRIDAMGYIRLFYPNFVVLVVLGHKDSLVITFPKNWIPRVGGKVSTLVIPLPPHRL